MSELTPAQMKMRRYEDWYIDHKIGRPGADGRRLIPRSLEVIAKLYGVSKQAVHRGIREVEERRRAIADAIAEEEAYD
jgi:hypothetical protein